MSIEQELPEMKPIKDYADVYTVAEFAECVDCGGFIPYDGSGYWATETLESRLSVWEQRKPEWATHVTWYNR